MPDALEKLVKNSGGSEAVPTEASKKINEAKRRLCYICDPLVLESTEYKPERTVNSIEIYIKANPVDRILYSEISSFIVGLNEKERATVSTNLDTLISYVLDNGVESDVRKISIKLYDHFQLNLIQLENARAASDKALTESIVEEKEKLHKEVKGIEKEYITILGIFAAIMLAFVGSFTFSTSVLNNISQTNAHVLILVALVVGLVFVVLITVLIDFLRDINEKSVVGANGNKKLNNASKWAIIVLSLLIALTLLGNAISKIKLPEKVYIGTIAEEQKQEEDLTESAGEQPSQN